MLGLKTLKPLYLGGKNHGFHGFQLRCCLNQFIATWLFWWHLMGPFFQAEMEKNAAEMGGEGASWWDLMGLKLGYPMVISMGKMTENDDCPLVIKNRTWNPLKSPCSSCSKWRLEWNNPLELVVNWATMIQHQIWALSSVASVDILSSLQLSAVKVQHIQEPGANGRSKGPMLFKVPWHLGKLRKKRRKANRNDKKNE